MDFVHPCFDCRIIGVLTTTSWWENAVSVPKSGMIEKVSVTLYHLLFGKVTHTDESSDARMSRRILRTWSPLISYCPLLTKIVACFHM